jgi:hypothetical protein
MGMTELTDDQIDAVWDSVPWQDLSVNSLEHVKVLRRRFARALIATHPTNQRNQCDGCNIRAPLDAGLHAMPDGGYMACTADRYDVSAEQRMPEGCTPADARKLREANHRLADENRQQARTIAFLRDQNRRIIEVADRIHDNAARDTEDAARYRWLHRQAVAVKRYASGNPNWEIDWALRGESFESAIDAARKAEIERIDRSGGEV